MLHDFPIIVADESVDWRIVKSLKEHGYSVYSILEEQSGISDDEVIAIAIEKGGFIITEDKDFGDVLVYSKEGLLDVGSMLLRIFDQPIQARIRLVIDALRYHSEDMKNCFSVLTAKKLRIRKYGL